MEHGARETSEGLKNRAQHILSQRNTSWAVRFDFTLTPTESYTMAHVTPGTSPASGFSALPAVWFEHAQVSPALCLKCLVCCCPVMSTCPSRDEKYVTMSYHSTDCGALMMQFRKDAGINDAVDNCECLWDTGPCSQ